MLADVLAEQPESFRVDHAVETVEVDYGGSTLIGAAIVRQA
jgi:hypothetical protein